jgi:hypothetical protein
MFYISLMLEFLLRLQRRASLFYLSRSNIDVRVYSQLSVQIYQLPQQNITTYRRFLILMLLGSVSFMFSIFFEILTF